MQINKKIIKYHIRQYNFAEATASVFPLQPTRWCARKPGNEHHRQDNLLAARQANSFGRKQYLKQQ